MPETELPKVGDLIVRHIPWLPGLDWTWAVLPWVVDVVKSVEGKAVSLDTIARFAEESDAQLFSDTLGHKR